MVNLTNKRRQNPQHLKSPTTTHLEPHDHGINLIKKMGLITPAGSWWVPVNLSTIAREVAGQTLELNLADHVKDERESESYNFKRGKGGFDNCTATTATGPHPLVRVRFPRSLWWPGSGSRRRLTVSTGNSTVRTRTPRTASNCCHVEFYCLSFLYSWWDISHDLR